MTNILFIAFEFPPFKSGGIYRSIAFTKYLPEFQINPIVLTLAESSYNDVYGKCSIDEDLKNNLSENTVIIEVGTDKPNNTRGYSKFISIYFNIHGNEVNYWKNNFYHEMKKAVEIYQPCAIFATVPPFSVLPLVTKIAKQLKLPLILDFRDAWSQWCLMPYGTIFHYWKTVLMERKYFKMADAIIATSLATISDFKKLHPKIQDSKFHYIPNGYDGVIHKWQPIDTKKEIYTIGYVGSFYYAPDGSSQMLKPWWKKRGHRMLQYVPHRQDWLYRSPYFFFRAMKQLNFEFPFLAKKIRIKFAGKKHGWVSDMIKEFALQDQVELMGELSHNESILFQENCDALLITSAKQHKGKDYSIAGKTFEYLQMQKPIIAFVCEGAQKDILLSTGTALLCDPDNTNEAVIQLHDLFTGKSELRPENNFIKSLSRIILTKKLAELIKQIGN